jgi:phosphoserine aminotransferase
MTMRVHNFGAGPAALPLPVLERAREEFLDFAGVGSSILEVSHRSPAYSRVHGEAIDRLRGLLGSAADHEILFMTGGARTQFSAVPMNLLAPGQRAGYVTTGRWSELALAAAARFGQVDELWSSRETGFASVPQRGEVEADRHLAYLHYTSNNTIFGTQYSHPPEVGPTPLVCDMSSDFLAAPLDLAPFGVVYAGAQKNLGPAGVTIVLVRKDLVEGAAEVSIDTLSYRLMAAKNSLLNTPPVFAIYLVGLVLEHLEGAGGLSAAAERNQMKSEMLYRAIDDSGEFYRGHARRDSRSRMNVTFRLPSSELESRFVELGSAEGLVGLKGHRSVGGIRASIYNAIEIGEVEALCSFMVEFQRAHG